MDNNVLTVFGHSCYLYLKDNNNQRPSTSVLMKNEKNINFVVSWCGLHPDTNEELRLYYNFQSHEEFFAFMRELPSDFYCFYEVYIKEHNKGIKLYYDVDIDLKKEENKNIDLELAEGVKSEIIEKTIEELSFLNLKPSDFSVYTTHRKGKFSFHILLQGYYFKDNEVIKHIAKNVKNRCHDWVKPFFDSSVYKSVQQFRLIYNKKYGTDVFKTECETFKFNDKIIKPKTYDLYDSLITNVENCQFVNIDIDEIPQNIYKCKNFYDYDIEEVIKIFKESYDNENVFNVKEVKGNMILLHRTKRSFCELHNRIHDHENAFLVIKGKSGKIYFYCRREESKKLLIGITNPDENQTLNIIKGYQGEDDLALLFIRAVKDNIKIITKKGPLFIWNEDTKLWEEYDIDTLHGIFIRPVLQNVFSINKTYYNNRFNTTKDKEQKLQIEHMIRVISSLESKIASSITLKHIQEQIIYKIIDKNFMNLLNSKSDLLPLYQNIIKTEDMHIKNHIVINLKTGEVRPREKEDYFTYELDINYNPKAKSEKFDTFIKQITCNDICLIDDLQRILGYCITGEVVKSSFIFYGSGDNGKSTLIAIMEQLFGKSNFITSINPMILSNEYRRTGATEEIYKLKDTRIAIANEAGKITFNKEFLKVLSSGGLDKIECRQLFKAPVTFIPRFKLILIMNELPNIGYDIALLNRIKIIKFAAEFTNDKEKVNEDKHIYPKNTNIVKEFFSSDDTKSAILNWFIFGAKKYYMSDDLVLNSKIIIEETNNYKLEMDSVKNFVEACCEFVDIDPHTNKEVKTSSSTLHKKYLEYCNNNNFTPLIQKRFSQELMKKYNLRQVKNSIMYFIGIRIAHEIHDT